MKYPDYFFFKIRNICLHGEPDSFIIYTKIMMNNFVSHP